MKITDDMLHRELVRIEVASLRALVCRIDYSSELSIKVVAIRHPDGFTDWQVRCRHDEINTAIRRESQDALGDSRIPRRHRPRPGAGRCWIRAVSRDNIECELEILRASKVPAMPIYTDACWGYITELTVDGNGYGVTYSWGSIEPPSGYESLVRFANCLERWACVDEVMGRDRALNSYLTKEELIKLAGRKIVARGLRYFEVGFVADLYEVNDELRATVRGTETYAVRIWDEDGELSYRCGCPMGARGLCCKHVVAVGLAWKAEI